MRRAPVLIAATSSALAVALVGGPGAEGATGSPAGDVRRPTPTAVSVAPWVAVSGQVGVTAQPDVLRVGDKLHVIWSQTEGQTRSVLLRTLDARAKPSAPTATVVSGWLAVIEDPKLFLNGTDLVAAFAGIHGYGAGPPVGPMVSARSADGATWNLAPGMLTHSTAAGSSQNIDAIDAGGEPFVAFSGFSPALRLHRGFITGAPTDTPDFNAADGGSYYVSLARDVATGEVWAAWHMPNGDPSQVGTRVQRVWPQPAGPALLAPGSVTAAGQSSGPGQPVALAARVGGGVWVAYLPGYPTSSTIRLWRVGSSTWRDVAAGGTAGLVALTSAPSGRLWLSWVTLGDHALHAVRTNRAVTALGTVRRIIQPGGPTSQVDATVTEGSRGPLDIIASTQVSGAGEPTLYALQVLPALGIQAKPARLRDGKVRVTVTDAGSPVARATVTFRGTKAQTNARGKVKFTVSRAVKDGRYPAVAKKAGYLKATTRVRIT